MPPEESETLIGRIVDHEATPQELQRFEQLAGDGAPLWRRLALDQLDMGLLAGRVREETARADRVDAVPPAGGRPIALTLSGWAAAVLLAASWVIVAGMGDRTARTPALRLDPAAGAAAAPELTPKEHLQAYLGSDFVVGELDPVVMETEPLDNGMHRVWFMRRIKEFVDIKTPPDATTKDGKLKVNPADLRQ